MEGGTANKDTAPFLGKTKIRIASEIPHRVFGTALMACYLWHIYAGLIFYDMQYPESDALSLGRKIFWSWIGIWGVAVVSGLVWKNYQEG